MTAPHTEAAAAAITLDALHKANIIRQAEWCAGGDPEPDLAFRGVELAGETGEALNVIKKLERERRGWRGSRASMTDLAEELADVVICADLCAVSAGIDLGAAVVAKFNATSDKVGLTTKLPASTAPAVPGDLQRLSDAATPGEVQVFDGQPCVHSDDMDGGFTLTFGGLGRTGSGRCIYRFGYAEEIWADMHPADHAEAKANIHLLAGLWNAFRSGALLATPHQAKDDGLREAAEALLDACVEDMGYGDETGDYPDRDDEATAMSSSGPCAVQFGHLRRLRAALSRTQARPAADPVGGWSGLSAAEVVRRTRCQADDYGAHNAAVWRVCCDEILQRLAPRPASQAPAASAGREGLADERRLEVTTGSDGRFVLSSLGGGMPIAIRMTEAEAAEVVAALAPAAQPGPASREEIADIVGRVLVEAGPGMAIGVGVFEKVADAILAARIGADGVAGDRGRIAKLCDRLDRLSTVDEPWACSEAMDEARGMILALAGMSNADADAALVAAASTTPASGAESGKGDAL